MNVSSEILWMKVNAGIGTMLNILLVLTIITDTQLPGSGYKKMLILIAAYHMTFSFVHCFVELICVYDGDGFMCFSERMRHYGYWESFWATVLYSFMSSQSLSLFAVHCCYRYVNITGIRNVKWRTGNTIDGHSRNYSFLFARWYYIVLVAIVSTLFGAAYATSVGVLMKPSPERNILSRDVLAAEYNVDIETVGYVGTYFQFPDGDGVMRYHMLHILGTGICSTVLMIVYITTCVVGVRLYFFVRNGTYTSSARSLHMQLLCILLAQGTAPLITDFTPLSIMLSGGLFGIFPPNTAMYMPITVSSYPGIDAFMIMFMFKAYRDRCLYNIKRCFCFWKQHKDPSAEVTIKSVSVTRIIGPRAKEDEHNQLGK